MTEAGKVALSVLAELTTLGDIEWMDDESFHLTDNGIKHAKKIAHEVGAVKSILLALLAKEADGED